MTKYMPRKDVVIVGLGWTGAIMAQELTDEGLDVVALERGPWRDTATDFNIGYVQDELRYAIRKDLFLQPATEAMTMRNNSTQVALPIREYGSFLPGNGVGGAGVHWNGHSWRFWDSDFRIKTHLTERYGASRLEGLTVQDWGISGDEIEPYMDRFEYLAGISGKAGNIRGVIQEGGNPFEDSRSRDYPLPPMEMTYAPTLFAETARSIGWHPFPTPSANLSKAYVNPLGVAMGQCTFCGFCERFGCANYSKSSAQTTILPVLMKKQNFELRTDSEVLHINLHTDGKMAKGVTYTDSSGEEYFQPADIVLVCAFILHNARLMMLSGIGEIYDPKTGKGTIGRNYAYQTAAVATLFFKEKNFNPFVAAGALGQTVDDFNGDAFDHSKLDFVGGAGINCLPSNGRPIGNRPVPEGTPKWGSEWKKATQEAYKGNFTIFQQGSSYPTSYNHLDLDPTYKDRFGRPLLRITFDFPDNDLRMSHFISDRVEELAKASGSYHYEVPRLKRGWDTVPYQTTHNTGGVVMGENPETSAVNRYLQSWDVPNVFVIGASAFAHNAGKNPTVTVGALAYWAADAIRNKYLNNPGLPLVSA